MKATHVAVLYKSIPYYFRAMNDDGSVGVDEEGIKKILEAIMNVANFVHSHDGIKHHDTHHDTHSGDDDIATSGVQSQFEASVGVLTTMDRTSWAETREALVRHSPEHNTGVLRIIDSAL